MRAHSPGYTTSVTPIAREGDVARAENAKEAQ